MRACGYFNPRFYKSLNILPTAAANNNNYYYKLSRLLQVRPTKLPDIYYIVIALSGKKVNRKARPYTRAGFMAITIR